MQASKELAGLKIRIRQAYGFGKVYSISDHNIVNEFTTKDIPFERRQR